MKKAATVYAQMDLIEAMSQLMTLFNSLKGMMNEKDSYAWTENCLQEPRNIRKDISAHYTNIWYDDNMKALETKKLAGFISVDNETYHLIKKINKLKEKIEAIITSMRSSEDYPKNASLIRLVQGAHHHRDEVIEKQLAMADLRRVNLLQLYRRIPLLSEQPQIINFTWASGNTVVKKIDIYQAKDLVEKFIDSPDDKAVFHDRLDYLSETTELAISRPVQPHLKANLRWEGNRRRAIVAHSPIAYRASDGFPLHRWPGSYKEPAKRMQRSDKKLQAEPYIKPLFIYLYQ